MRVIEAAGRNRLDPAAHTGNRPIAARAVPRLQRRIIPRRALENRNHPAVTGALARCRTQDGCKLQDIVQADPTHRPRSNAARRLQRDQM
ncbi:MAG: hypothetical protein AAFR46_07475, partial [Pseudomonadota bacterium]